MKKLLSILLALSLLFSVSLALAEEPAGEEPAAEASAAEDPAAAEEANLVQGERFPYIPFGMEMKDAITFVEGYYGTSGIHFTEDSERTNRTLSDGTTILEVSSTGQLSRGEISGTIEVKLYFEEDGKLTAGTVIYRFNAGTDMSLLRNQMIRYIDRGISKPLVASSFGRYVEMLGETAHIEDGIASWDYTRQAIVPGMEQPVTIKAVVTLQSTEDTLYIAAFPNPKAQNQPQSQAEKGASRYDELTPEGKQAADLYAKFLEVQMHEQLNKFIEFLLKNQ